MIGSSSKQLRKQPKSKLAFGLTLIRENGIAKRETDFLSVCFGISFGIRIPAKTVLAVRHTKTASSCFLF